MEERESFFDEEKERKGQRWKRIKTKIQCIKIRMAKRQNKQEKSIRRRKIDNKI